MEWGRSHEAQSMQKESKRMKGAQSLGRAGWAVVCRLLVADYKQPTFFRLAESQNKTSFGSPGRLLAASPSRLEAHFVVWSPGGGFGPCA